MERLIHKTSTVIVAAGDGTSVFRSVDEVPPELRRRLVKATSSPEAVTILIADENGRKEILRSLQVEPGAPARSKDRWEWRHWAEMALVAGIGICLWALSYWN